jgi:hypothetical protein
MIPREHFAPASAAFCACCIYAFEDNVAGMDCWLCGQMTGLTDALGEQTVGYLHNELAKALAELEAVKNERDLAVLTLAAFTPADKAQPRNDLLGAYSSRDAAEAAKQSDYATRRGYSAVFIYEVPVDASPDARYAGETA